MAVTGAMGSGKSSFCEILSGMGVKVLDCDKIAKSVLFEDAEAKGLVRALLGEDCFGADFTPDTAKIARKVFANAGLLKKYEEIIHPRAEKIWRALAQKEALCAVEVPLLFEKNLQGGFDASVCVFVPETLRRERLFSRGMSSAEIARRDAFQLPQAEKVALSDIAVFNGGSFDFLKAQTEILIKRIS